MFSFFKKQRDVRFQKELEKYLSMSPEEREFYRFDFYSERLHWLEWSVRCISFSLVEFSLTLILILCKALGLFSF